MWRELKRPAAIWLVPCVLIGVCLVIAAARPDPGSTAERVAGVRAAPDAPIDVALPPLSAQADVDMLVHSRIWRGDPESGKAAAPESAGPQRWWLMAVYGQGPTRAVIVGQTGQPERILRPGDVLPSGDPIVDITPKGVCVLLNGQRRLLPVVESTAKVW